MWVIINDISRNIEAVCSWNLAPNLVPIVFVPLDQRSENESSRSNHFEIKKEITDFCPSGCAVYIYGACLKWLLPDSCRRPDGSRALGTRMVHHNRNKMTPLMLLPWQQFGHWCCLNKNSVQCISKWQRLSYLLFAFFICTYRSLKILT